MTNRQIIISALKKAFPNKNDIDFALVNAYYDSNVDKVYYVDIFDHRFAKAFWGENQYFHFDEGSIYEDRNGNLIHYDIEAIEESDEEHLIEDGNNHKGNYHWYIPVWQYHLQMMVLEENPLKYLEKFLNETLPSKTS